mgnify:CR=1 FL=1
MIDEFLKDLISSTKKEIIIEIDLPEDMKLLLEIARGEVKNTKIEIGG